jgi:hypothetical protein
MKVRIKKSQTELKIFSFKQTFTVDKRLDRVERFFKMK